MNVSSKREGRRAAQGTFAHGLKAVLAAVLTVVLVLQGSNLQAYADDLIGAQAPEDEVIVSDVVADDEAEGEKDDAVVTDEVETESGDEDVVTETESETPPAAETEEAEEAETPKATTTSVEPQLLSTTSAQPTTNAATSSRELVESRVIGIGEKWDIETSSGDSIVYSHRWSSNNNAAATVSNSGVVTGESAGTAVITHSWGVDFFGWHEAGSETFSVVVLPEGSYKVWLYSLLPNMDINADAPADMKWNGMGQAVVSGVNDPSTYEKNTALSDSYTLRDLPTSYPDIVVDGKTYEYAAPGSGNEDKADYYTLEWERLVVADGANAGNNGYNEVVDTGTPTFHLDGLIQYNIEDRCNVTFKVQMPNSKTFETKTAFNVAEGTSESDLNAPAMDDEIVNGITYEFGGWYKDQDCTIRAEFNGAVDDDVTYYGRYKLSMATLSYDPNGGSGSMETNSAALGAGVWVAENEFTRDGYVFTGWNTAADGSGTDYNPNVFFQFKTKANVLYAQWKADVTGFKVDDAEWYYDGTSHGIKVYGAREGDKVDFCYKKADGQSSSELIVVAKGNIENDGSVRGGNGLIDVADSGTVEVKLYRDMSCVASDSAKVTIKKRQVEIRSNSGSKVYDGSPLTAPGVTITSSVEPDQGGGFASNEGVICTYEGSTLTNVGSISNEFAYKGANGTDLDNYEITKVAGTLTVTPVTITVTAGNLTKVEGDRDPSLTTSYDPRVLVGSEEPGWDGEVERVPGEEPGSYAINQGTLELADGENGFLAKNYDLEFVPGTLTITAADNGNDDDTPVTPVDPVDPGDDDDNPGGGGTTTGGGTNPVPVAVTAGDDADDTDDAEDEETVEEDETPLADGTESDSEQIGDDTTPLASGETNEQTCWTHWVMLAGLGVTVVYFALSAARTRRATNELASFEDDVLGGR